MKRVGSFSIVVRGIQLMIEALKANGQPKVPSTRTRGDGQIVANVYPPKLLEKVMLANVDCRSLVEKGKELTQGRSTVLQSKPVNFTGFGCWKSRKYRPIGYALQTFCRKRGRHSQDEPRQ